MARIDSPRRIRALALVSALFLSACAMHPAAPREFAVYPRGFLFKGPLRAVSPDGVIYSVRTEKQKPKADAAFWREALVNRMGQAGYRVISDTSLTMKGRDGTLLKLAAPVGDQDYHYWIAFTPSPSGRRILVAEAAGESKRFLARQEEIRKAMAESGW